MSKTTEIVATLALVVVAIVVVAVRNGSHREQYTSFIPTDPDSGLVVDLPSADTLAMRYQLGHSVGTEDAPIRIIEWGDYGCSFCLELAAAIDSVQQRFPGMISVIWLYALPNQSDRRGNGPFMANATECVADQVPFDALYTAVLLEGKRIDNRARFIATVSDLGVEDERLLRACIDSWAHRDRLFRLAQLGNAAKVRGTPTWFLNETRYDFAVSAATLQQMALTRLRR